MTTIKPVVKPLSAAVGTIGKLEPLGEFSPITIDKKIKQKINEKLPSQLIQQKPMGKNKPSLSYISGSTVTDILNATFGIAGWSTEILEQWMEKGVPFVNKYNNNTLEEQNPIAFVKIRLTVMLTDEKGNLHYCHKEAFGSKAVVGKQSEQESTYKAAQTDALKKAASLFGIGLELYRKEEEAEYFMSINVDPTWTEENIAKHKEAYDYLMAVKESGNESYLNQCVEYLTASQIKSFDYVPEDKINSLYTMVKEAMEGAVTE